MEHIPAIHAMKVGMRYPGRVTYVGTQLLNLELDLTRLAPGRAPTLYVELRFDQTVFADRTRQLAIGDQLDVVLIAVSRYPNNFESLLVSLPAEPEWLTWNNGTVRQLARRIRETGETVLLPVLADALEEAGCTDATLLDYCRQSHEDEIWSWAVELLATQE